MHPPYGSWVEISTATLEANARAIRAAVPGKRVIAIVKSDAYGHGIERAVEAKQARHLVVFLRKGHTARIFCHYPVGEQGEHEHRCQRLGIG